MRMKSVLLVVALTLALSVQALGQAAERISVTFATQDDDKSGTTQIQDHLVCDNHDVAVLLCCGANQDNDHWHPTRRPFWKGSTTVMSRVNTTTSREPVI
jgi:hypothetical protein